MKKLFTLLLILLLTTPAYASYFTTNYNLEHPAIGSRDVHSVISQDYISIDRIMGIMSSDISGLAGGVWERTGTVVTPKTAGDSVSVDSSGTLTVSGDTFLANVGYPTDTPADNEIIKYDASLGRLNFEADGGGSNTKADIISNDANAYTGPFIIVSSDVGTLTTTQGIISSDISTLTTTQNIISSDISSYTGPLSIVSSDVALISNTVVILSNDVSALSGASVGGSNNEIQYNQDGSFAGSDDFIWDDTNNTFRMSSDTTTLDSFIVSNDSLTTGTVAKFVSNSADNSGRNLIFLVNENAAADTAIALKIKQDGDASPIDIDFNGAGDTSPAVNIETVGDRHGYYINHTTTVLDAGYALVHASSDTANVNGARIANFSQGEATATDVVMRLKNDGAGPHINFVGDPTVASPSDGDLWYTGSGLKFNDGTTTYDFVACSNTVVILSNDAVNWNSVVPALNTVSCDYISMDSMMVIPVNNNPTNINFDGSMILENDTNSILMQMGDGTTITANTDLRFPAIHQKDIAILEPDQVATVTPDVIMFTVDSYNYPQGIEIVAMRLATPIAASSVSYKVMEWTDPTGAGESTIDTLVTSSATESTDTSMLDSTVAVGGYVVVSCDSTDIAQAHLTVWYYAPYST